MHFVHPQVWPQQAAYVDMHRLQLVVCVQGGAQLASPGRSRKHDLNDGFTHNIVPSHHTHSSSPLWLALWDRALSPVATV